MNAKERERLKEVAIKYACDYPDINIADFYETVYAIECALEGITEANNDLHDMINVLCKHFGISLLEALEIYENS
jgi:hypothetical protein